MIIAVGVLFAFVLQILVSGAIVQEMVNVLVPSPKSPISTSSGVFGSLQCTKNSDESYAVCASFTNTAIKYNLQPFSFSAKGPSQGNSMISCDLYETSSQSTSRVICAKRLSGTSGTVYFHRVSDMSVNTTAAIGITGNYPHVIVDTPNQVAYISNYNTPPAIYKIINISSSTPIVAGNLTSFGSVDVNPAAMLIIDGFLYVHFSMGPSRLVRITISSFTWNQTVVFSNAEGFSVFDNLANDDNFIYDLTGNGYVVRCTFKNSIFARFDSLFTGYGATTSLAISPDFSMVLLTASASGILLVNTSTFTIDATAFALLPNPASSGYVKAFGRPIILSKNNNTNTYPVCAFSQDNDFLYTFNVSRVPFREAYPSIYPLPTSPINTSSGVVGSLQCTKDSDESYAICGSLSNIAIKYNLQPFSFAAKGPNQANWVTSCDLFETSSQSTSRAVCTGDLVFVYYVSDVTVNATVAVSYGYHVIIDTPNQVAFVSGAGNSPAIFKISNIGTNPELIGTIVSFGSGDNSPTSMLIIDGFLYIHLSMIPARLVCMSLASGSPTWVTTISFNFGENRGYYDNLANDKNYIYDLTINGILVRCTYKNNNFARFDSLNIGLTNTQSLAISPDLRTLFLTSQIITQANGVLQMIDVHSFTMFGNNVPVLAAFGRPIVTSWLVYAFSQGSDAVYAFRYDNPTRSPTKTVTLSVSASESETTSRHDNTATTTLSVSSTRSESPSLLECPRVLSESLCITSHCKWCPDLNGCVPPSASCSCDPFSIVAATVNQTLCPSSQCEFCKSSQTCVNASDSICSCALASSSSSTCAGSGQCFWCSNKYSYFGRAPNSVNLCVDNETSRAAALQLCSCSFLQKNICTYPGVPCEWCDSTGGCFDPSVKSCEKVRCTDFTNVSAAGQCPSPACRVCDGICVNATEYFGERCRARFFDRITCDACHNCTWNEKVVSGVDAPEDYCVISAMATECASPLTCTSINLPGFDRENQCEAAGCKYDRTKQECLNHGCFNLFLPSWIMQPIGLMIIGFIKDVIVLLLFGVFGDRVVKILKAKIWVPFQFWKNNWNRKRVKINLERTIYVNDEKARDHTSDKRESFEEYCVKIADKFFELPETNDEEIRKVWKRRIVDAVTFAMFDTGLWFDLDDDGYGKLEHEKAKNPNGVEALMLNGNDEDNENREQEIRPQHQFSPKDAEKEEKNENDAILNHPVVRKLQRQSSEQQKQICEQQKTLAEHESRLSKTALLERDLNSRSVLQEIVRFVITRRATCVVYYASSRDTSVRAATALNQFPSSLQLFYYLLGIIFLVSASLYAVAIDEKNKADINRIATYTCITSNSTTTDNNVARSAFFLMGFRLMNASTVATVFLVLVKTIRALWFSFGDRFNQLQLSQRLPIMGLYTQRTTKILLALYFIVVLIFALAGFVYAFTFAPSMKVLGISLGIFAGDILLLKLIRFASSKFQENHVASQKKEVKADEEELASRLNSHVNFDQNENQQQEHDFDQITAEEVINVKKQSLSNSAPTSLPQALIVFLLTEEFPTVLLTISLQLCYNYMCLVEYKSSFGFTDENVNDISTKEYDSRSMDCIWELFQNDVSGYANGLSSFVTFL